MDVVTTMFVFAAGLASHPHYFSINVDLIQIDLVLSLRSSEINFERSGPSLCTSMIILDLRSTKSVDL